MPSALQLHVSRESYSFELFDLPLDVPLENIPVPVDFFDLRCESVTYCPKTYIKTQSSESRGQEKQPAQRLPSVYYTRRDCVQKNVWQN